MDIFEVTKAPFVTPPNIVLPPWDVNGQLHGEGYKAAKKARTQKLVSTRATHRGMKFKRRYESLAQTEFYPLIGWRSIRMSLMYATSIPS
ncbi:hypothetical protein AWV80_05345 [Cupriavidus sp. UYMU48A]|nr:hypothetical protein AWV80_05345 [Cupriavidus sp. UYMU48A]